MSTWWKGVMGRRGHDQSEWRGSGFHGAGEEARICEEEEEEEEEERKRRRRCLIILIPCLCVCVYLSINLPRPEEWVILDFTKQG